MPGTTKNVSPEWLRAAEQLAKDPSALVTCPSCGKATLVTRDDRVWEGKVERVFECKVCGKHGSVLVASDEKLTEQGQDVLRDSSNPMDNAIAAVRAIKKKSQT